MGKRCCVATGDTLEDALNALTAHILDAEAVPAGEHTSGIGPGDPVILRFHGDVLDEVVATRQIHLERFDDAGWYLGVGDLQVWLQGPGGTRVDASFEPNNETIIREKA